jgi:hypothetical protein
MTLNMTLNRLLLVLNNKLFKNYIKHCKKDKCLSCGRWEAFTTFVVTTHFFYHILGTSKK